MIYALTPDDLNDIKALQPDDWPDIVPALHFYAKSSFCFPVKYLLNSTLAGTGTLIVFGKTAWLAHIIVDKRFRNLGIGGEIVGCLMERAVSMGCSSVQLIATTLGEPVYQKVGFRTITEYIFLERETFMRDSSVANEVIPYQFNFKQDMLELDKMASGENRELLMDDHLLSAYMYITDNQLRGFYLPSLGEGLIIAVDRIAGWELLKFRNQQATKVVVPVENINAIALATEQGFKDVRHAKRMAWGATIEWKPQMLWNRIGGNLG